MASELKMNNSTQTDITKTPVDYEKEWYERIVFEWLEDYFTNTWCSEELETEFDGTADFKFKFDVCSDKVVLPVQLDEQRKVVKVNEPVSSSVTKEVVFEEVFNIDVRWKKELKAMQLTFEKLKFVPVDYEITIMGECQTAIIGSISDQAYQYWKSGVSPGGVTLKEIDFYYGNKGNQVPDYARIFPEEDLFLHDDVYHEILADPYNSYMVIDDDNEDRILELDLDEYSLKSEGIKSFFLLDVNDLLVEGQPVYIGDAYQFGKMFIGQLKLFAPFDVKKLSVGIVIYEKRQYVHSVYYDGVRVDEIKSNTNMRQIKCKVYMP
jgi:hypothetical protein